MMNKTDPVHILYEVYIPYSPVSKTHIKQMVISIIKITKGKTLDAMVSHEKRPKSHLR